MIPEIGSGAFDNLVMEQAWAAIEPVLMEIIETRIRNHDLAGYVKPTWAELKKLPEEEAIQQIAQMLLQPWWRKDGLAFTRRLLDELGGEDEPT